MDKLKKNQIVVYAIALMLVVAGYLNYIENNKTVEISAQNQNTNIGDATLVNSNEIAEGEENNSKEDLEISGEDNNESSQNSESDTSLKESTEEKSSVETNSKVEDDYFANSRIEREKMYSQMLETYQKMLENASISEEQKSIATQEIKKINDTKNAIMICENLISIKGFSNSVVLSNGESINVVVEAEELSQEDIAQIQNVLTREMNTSMENIHIMKK